MSLAEAYAGNQSRPKGRCILIWLKIPSLLLFHHSLMCGPHTSASPLTSRHSSSSLYLLLPSGRCCCRWEMPPLARRASWRATAATRARRRRQGHAGTRATRRCHSHVGTRASSSRRGQASAWARCPSTRTATNTRHSRRDAHQRVHIVAMVPKSRPTRPLVVHSPRSTSARAPSRRLLEGSGNNGVRRKKLTCGAHTTSRGREK